MLNLTQHKSTPEQNCVDLEGGSLMYLKSMITFDSLPGKESLIDTARALSEMAEMHGYKKAMIGGAPFFMPYLERALRSKGITPYYAFSKREVVEKDGVKTSIFKHIGFVEGGA